MSATTGARNAAVFSMYSDNVQAEHVSMVLFEQDESAFRENQSSFMACTHIIVVRPQDMHRALAPKLLYHTCF